MNFLCAILLNFKNMIQEKKYEKFNFNDTDFSQPVERSK